MGKNLISQKRGKGSPSYRSPSFRFQGQVKHIPLTKDILNGKVVDITHCPGHTSPLAEIVYEDMQRGLVIAPEGLAVGDNVCVGSNDTTVGNTNTLRNIPEGTLIHNIESNPGDGGKFVRSSGTFGKVISKTGNKVTVQLPSKKYKDFNPECRAGIGVVAGGGRPEKPFVKAGKKHHAMKARNKMYPNVSAAAMNAVDHPFGGARSSRKGRPTIAPRNAPPGRKVGMIRPRHTGRNK